MTLHKYGISLVEYIGNANAITQGKKNADLETRELETQRGPEYAKGDDSIHPFKYHGNESEQDIRWHHNYCVEYFV